MSREEIIKELLEYAEDYSSMTKERKEKVLANLEKMSYEELKKELENL